jgi:hypothetical protein
VRRIAQHDSRRAPSGNIEAGQSAAAVLALLIGWHRSVLAQKSELDAGSVLSVHSDASSTRGLAMLLRGGFNFQNFLVDALTIFLFIVWLWLLITVAADLFRRRDISGWGKAIWVIALVVLSYLAVLAYLITQGRGMAERNAQQAQETRDELRRVVGFSVADEITKLDALKGSGSITDQEFARLRARLVQ